MRKNTLIIAILVIVIIGGWWYLHVSSQNQSEVIIDTVTTTTPASSGNGTVQTDEVKPGTERYENEEFGFSFEYPTDWKYRIPEFGSPVSLFNMGLLPEEQESIGAVVLNITPKYWIENAMKSMEARGVIFEEIQLDDHEAFQALNTDRVSRPATLTLVLINDEFWIGITGLTTESDVYNQILGSFEINHSAE